MRALALAMAVTPQLSVFGSAPSIGALFVSGAIAPVILERLGAISPTIAIDPAGIHLHAPAVGGAEGPALPLRFSAYTYTVPPMRPVQIDVDDVFVKRQ